MSLELKIEALTASVNQLIAVMSAANTPQVAQPSLGIAPTAPVAPAPVAAAPVMPGLPSFTSAPTTQAPAPQGAPFNTPAGVMDYTMSAYKAMGPEKGGKIQSILAAFGIANLNDLKPEHYGAFHQQVETLKVS